MPAVSIIMPVYNVESYVRKAVESVLQQSYEDFELIIVNDGTEDDSMTIVNDLAEKDHRIFIINQQNKGLSAARNSGVRAASGQYVCFIDSDDEVNKDLLNITMKKITDSYPDVLMYGMVIERVGCNEKVLSTEVLNLNNSDYTKQSICEFILDDHSIELIGYSTNKMYKREILTRYNLTFDETIPFLEDIDFNEKVLAVINTLKVIDQCLYRYKRRNRPTLIKTFQIRHFELQLAGIHSRQRIFENWGIEREKIELSIAKLHMNAIRGSCSNLFHNLNNLSFLEKRRQVLIMLQNPLTASRVDLFQAITWHERLLKRIIMNKHSYALSFISSAYAYYKKHRDYTDNQKYKIKLKSEKTGYKVIKKGELS